MNTAYIALALLIALVALLTLRQHLKRITASKQAAGEAYLRQREVYKQGQAKPLHSNSQNRPSRLAATSYAPRYSVAMLVALVAFVLFVLLGLYLSRDAKSIPERYITLLFTAYGLIMLLKYFRTSYTIADALYVSSGFKTYCIDFSRIQEVEKRRINMLFKHGSKGRIRAETCSHTLFITFTDEGGRQRVAMISPKQQDEFIQQLLGKMS